MYEVFYSTDWVGGKAETYGGAGDADAAIFNEFLSTKNRTGRIEEVEPSEIMKMQPEIDEPDWAYAWEIEGKDGNVWVYALVTYYD